MVVSTATIRNSTIPNWKPMSASARIAQGMDVAMSTQVEVTQAALADLSYYNGAKQALVIAERDGLPVAHEWLAGQSEKTQRPALQALAAEAAARPVVERDLWHPIETAPKDGTTIDAWRDGTRETVYWGFPPHECGEMGSYCDSDWHGLKKPGWICSTFGEFVGGEYDPFTHWMPLPDGPAQSPEPIQSMLAQEEGKPGSAGWLTRSLNFHPGDIA